MCVKLSPEDLNSDPYPPHPHKHLNSDIFNTMLIHVASNQNNNNLNNKITFTYVSLRGLSLGVVGSTSLIVK